MKFNEYWFRPKWYGYGAYPVTWEGWLTVLSSIGLIILWAKLFSPNSLEFYGSILFTALVVMYISWKKTEGLWDWR